jgi:hypothetical protein
MLSLSALIQTVYSDLLLKIALGLILLFKVTVLILIYKKWQAFPFMKATSCCTCFEVK